MFRLQFQGIRTVTSNRGLKFLMSNSFNLSLRGFSYKLIKYKKLGNCCLGQMGIIGKLQQNSFKIFLNNCLRQDKITLLFYSLGVVLTII